MKHDWHQYTRGADGGHLLWTGTMHHGSPTLRTRRRRSVRHLSLEEQRGRRAVGRVTTTCGLGNCLAADHLADYTDRQRLYAQQAEALGMPTYRGVCRSGHDWAENAVFEPCGRRHCTACAQHVPEDTDPLAIEQVVAGYRVPLAAWTDRREAVRQLIGRGATHDQCAEAVGVASRTVNRWAVQHNWRKPKQLAA
ncbi:hypothetical protein [Streptacidiphilus sp. PAMC 29251]